MTEEIEKREIDEKLLRLKIIQTIVPVAVSKSEDVVELAKRVLNWVKNEKV